MPGDSDEGGPDTSMNAVNQRLRQFVAEVRARPEGEQRRFAESDKLLAAWAEDALAYQEKAARDRAELERRTLAQRGERLQ